MRRLFSGRTGGVAAIGVERCLVRWRENLAALLPRYDEDGGNCTRVCTTGGEVIHDRRTVKWNLRRLARSA